MFNTQLLRRTAALAGLPLALAACGGDSGGSIAGPDPIQFTVVDTQTEQANAINGIAHASDGSILAVGYSNNDSGDGDRRSVLMKFTSAGALDQSFGGGDGIIEYNLSVMGAGGDGDEQPYGVVELANGDLMLVINTADGNGDATNGEGTSVTLLRVDSDGVIDATFGTGGQVEVVFGWPDSANATFITDTGEADFPSDFAYDLLLDNRGGTERLVVVGFGPAAQGTTGNPADRDRYITRLLASDGSVDPGFTPPNATVGGAYTYSTDRTGGTTDNARRASLGANGEILSAGYTDLGAGLDNHVVLIQLAADGTPDSSFGNYTEPATSPQNNDGPGIAIFNPFVPDSGFAEAYAAVTQSTGGIVASGYGAATGGPTVQSSLGYAPTDQPDLVAFRALNNSTDASFGNNGTQAIQSETMGATGDESEERGRDMVLLPDDRTVHVGRFNGLPAVFVFTADGQLDTRVDNDGIITVPDTTAPIVEQQLFTSELSDTGTLAIGTRGNDPVGVRLLVVTGLSGD